jgi:hypothetical protein
MCTNSSREAVVRVSGCVRCQALGSATHLLLGLEVVEEDGALLRLLTPVLDDNARAVDNLARVTLTVDLAYRKLALTPHSEFIQRTKTGPLAELLAIGDLDERDLVLRAERNNELLVGFLLASLVEDAHVSLAAVEGLGGLAETAGKTVVDERELQHALESLKDGHLAPTGGGIGADFDLGGRGNLGLGIVFSVRLWCVSGDVQRCAGDAWRGMFAGCMLRRNAIACSIAGV